MIIPVAFVKELLEPVSVEGCDPSGGTYLNPLMQPLPGWSSRVAASRKDNMVLTGLLASRHDKKCQGCLGTNIYRMFSVQTRLEIL